MGVPLLTDCATGIDDGGSARHPGGGRAGAPLHEVVSPQATAVRGRNGPGA
ncbi:hypothetical protein ACO0M4_34055 [Streptomyces sp. RGM 3693]|uniref:hypothetical protein n=1 Tax=Streptomyces sp. RGM 3693 TaxID=3413284 RepID=UPI003D29367B